MATRGRYAGDRFGKMGNRTPLGISLDKLVQALKGSSSSALNKLMQREGRLWQPSYFDRVIRNFDHFTGVRRYIEWNPVKAKLCQDPVLWPWSSANAAACDRLELIKLKGYSP